MDALFYWTFPSYCEGVGKGYLTSILHIETLSFSYLHICLWAPPSSDAPGKQCIVCFSPLWYPSPSTWYIWKDKETLSLENHSLLSHESFHLTAPRFSSRSWHSVLSSACPRESDFSILLKSSQFYYPSHEANGNADLIKLEHPLDFDSEFLCQKEHKYRSIHLRSPEYQSGKKSREKTSFDRWKKLRS